MPQSIDSEKLVLGTLMTDRNALNEVRELLTPNTFYDKFHGQIYKAILDIADKGNRPDMIIVKNKLVSIHAPTRGATSSIVIMRVII